MKFRTKSEEVEAVEFTGTITEELAAFLNIGPDVARVGDKVDWIKVDPVEVDGKICWRVRTGKAGGVHPVGAEPGDWFVRTKRGLIYSTGPEGFMLTHDRLEPEKENRTCNDCCKRDVCAIVQVIDAARQATAIKLQQRPWTEEQMDRMDELWRPLRGLAEVCPYFLEETADA